MNSIWAPESSSSDAKQGLCVPSRLRCSSSSSWPLYILEDRQPRFWYLGKRKYDHSSKASRPTECIRCTVRLPSTSTADTT